MPESSSSFVPLDSLKGSGGPPELGEFVEEVLRVARRLDHKVLSLAVLVKIEELLREGATVLGARPERLVSLQGGEEAQKRFRQFADAIWGSAPEPGKRIKYGNGMLYTTGTGRQVLQDMGVLPDLEVGHSKFLDAARQPLVPHLVEIEDGPPHAKCLPVAARHQPAGPAPDRLEDAAGSGPEPLPFRLARSIGGLKLPQLAQIGALEFRGVTCGLECLHGQFAAGFETHATITASY